MRKKFPDAHVEEMMNKDEIIQLIEDAFKDVSYPGDKNIVFENQYDENYEGNRVAHFFGGKTWRRITLESLRSDYDGDGSACLFFMTPAAFRYYLPAYMIIAVTAYERADVIGDTAVYALSPPQRDDSAERWSRKISGFSKKQKAAIVKFLQFMHENYRTDDGALTRALIYWNKNL